MTEDQVQLAVCNYLRTNYPDVIFHNDFGSGLKMTIGQAKKQKFLNNPWRAYPDLFVSEPRRSYHGLYIELKRPGTRLKKKTGEWASEHIEEQAAMLSSLRERGYRAEFAVGYDEAIEILHDYLGEPDQLAEF